MAKVPNTTNSFAKAQDRSAPCLPNSKAKQRILCTPLLNVPLFLRTLPIPPTASWAKEQELDAKAYFSHLLSFLGLGFAPAAPPSDQARQQHSITTRRSHPQTTPTRSTKRIAREQTPPKAPLPPPPANAQKTARKRTKKAARKRTKKTARKHTKKTARKHTKKDRSQTHKRSPVPSLLTLPTLPTAKRRLRRVEGSRRNKHALAIEDQLTLSGCCSPKDRRPRPKHSRLAKR